MNSLLLVLLFIALIVILVLVFTIRKFNQKIEYLTRERKNFITLCDLIQAPIWFKDKDLKFTWVNDYYATMFDRPREELFGLTDLDIAPRKLVAGYVRDDEYVLESKKIYKYKENEKAGIWYETIKFPLLNDSNDILGIGGIAFNITAIKKSEKMLHNLVHNDYLTGISNRLFLSVEVTKKLTIVDEQHKKLAVILLDIDNFKDLNDVQGHVIGDEILKAMADKLKKFIGDRDLMLGRFGGDEFIIVIPLFEDESYVTEICNGIRNVASGSYNIYGSSFTINVSMGVSIYPNHGSDYEGLVRHADMALYYAKGHGKDCIVEYNETIGNSNLKRIKIETRLRNAIEKEEFFIYYQPKLSADGNQLIGMEALIRWNSHDLGFVSPAEFIPVAEQSDVIIDIGDWVMRTSMEQNLKWKEIYGEMYSVAVNLSAKQIKQPNFLQKILDLMKELNYPPQYLELELTEGMLTENETEVKQAFEVLRQMGVKISVDDFGTGYSNLGYLSKFPLDKLKIDRSFVTDINEKPEKQQIVNAIIQLATSFNLSLIAEGVENYRELKYLKDKGVEVVQGFYFSKPLPASDIYSFISSVKNGKYNQDVKNNIC